MARPDMPLIRHLCESQSPDVGRAWQRRPYLLLPGAGFAEYLFSRVREFAQQVPDIKLPWPDVILDFPLGLSPVWQAAKIAADWQLGHESGDIDVSEAVPNRGRCWIRVASGAAYLEHRATHSPYLTATLFNFVARDPGRWLVVEYWEERTLRPDGTLGFPTLPDVVCVPLDDPWRHTAARFLYPNPDCVDRRAFGAFCNVKRCVWPTADRRRLICTGSDYLMTAAPFLAVAVLAYLEIGDEYLVEITPPAPSRKTSAQAARGLKPWADPTLTHWILIDPRRARDYGHPSGVDEGGTHASPHPHRRRGHWRELRAERFRHDDDGYPFRTWIKPAWIGAQTWTDTTGQRYRLADPLKGSR